MGRIIGGVLVVMVSVGLVVACDDDQSDTAPNSTAAASSASSASTSSINDVAGGAVTPSSDVEAPVPDDDDQSVPGVVEEQHGVVTDESVAAALDQIDGFVQSEMDEFGVPGVAVAVVHDDEVVFAKGYGVRGVGKPGSVDANTVFQIASMSKPISATALSGLVGNGVIGWDEPVTQYNPDLVFSDPWVTDHVTFADLYSHRSGLPGGFGTVMEYIGYDRGDILSIIRRLPLGPFRASYSYSNFGMTVAGDAAARAAGTSFEDVMRTQLFGPAGMADTTVSYADFVTKDNRATLHLGSDGAWEASGPRTPDAQAPAGGLSSSVNDLTKWMRLVLGAGMLDGKQIIDEDALAETHVPHIVRRQPASYDQQPAFYGLGWNVDDDHLGFLRWGHSGAFTLGGATTVVLLPTEQLGVVVLSNTRPIGVPEIIADEIIDQIATGGITEDWRSYWREAFAPLAPPIGPTPPANPTPAHPDDAYTGTYRNDVFGDVQVIAQGSGLVLDFGGGRNTYPLTHFDAETFTIPIFPEEPDSPVPVEFVIGTDAKAMSLDLGDVEGSGNGLLERVS